MTRTTVRLCALILALLGTLATTGCGGGDDSTTPASTEFVKKAPIAVWAPTPLDGPFNEYALSASLNTQMSFASSLAASDQLRSGADAPDLFASDSEAILSDLADDGLVGDATPFATDELVIAVPKDSPIGSIDDLAVSGNKVAIAQEGSPLGNYARAAIDSLPSAVSKDILAGADTEDTNNNAIIEKVSKGKVDAGFLYATDVKANADKLRAVELPAEAKQQIIYSAAVVTDAENAPGAQHFLDAMVDGDGTKKLERAGFGPPPG
jgi:molybdate transport system substrate-binding protein